MEFDLLVRGGRVVDGSGLPGYQADLGVRDGRIAAIGRLKGSATRTIDADGLVVSPGFVDHHTHLDGQFFWDPYGVSEPQHGVTSVIMGNCGLTLAPVEPGGEDALVKSFVRVEAMPREALVAGIPWGWRSYGDYLNALEGNIGINVGGLVGHIAVRHAVMGEEGVERAATDAEIERMRAHVAESLEGGALGLSTNRNERHFREDGKPVSSRLATQAEFDTLCDVLGDYSAGVMETIVGLHTLEHIDWYDSLARRTGRPIIWQSVLHRWAQPDLWRQQLDKVANTFRDGYRAYGLTNTVPIVQRFTLQNVQAFDEFTTWKTLMFLPDVARKQAFADPATRDKLRAELSVSRPTTFHRRWDLINVSHVTRPEHAHYVGKSVADVATLRGQDPLDAFLDMSIEEDLQMGFWTALTGGDAEATGEILRSPYVMVGLSDAGAHVEFDAAFGYGTTLLGLWVRERGVMSLEQAIHKLTFQVASVYGLEGRGLLRPGYAADLAIFDPATVDAGEPEWATDFPANTRHLVQPSVGIHYTVVNGEVVYEDGRLSGTLPGQILRGTAARAHAAAAS